MTPDNLTVSDRTYRIQKLLGKGKGGYSFLASDVDGARVVVKQIHHEPCEYYAFGDKMRSELGDYKTLTQLGIRMPKLLHYDLDAERLVKEYIEGPTAFELVLRDALPSPYLAQMEQISDYLRDAGLNIDYFPTNFVVSNDLVYYVDYECNPYAQEWDWAHWGAAHWRKSPEFIRYVEGVKDPRPESDWHDDQCPSRLESIGSY